MADITITWDDQWDLNEFVNSLINQFKESDNPDNIHITDLPSIKTKFNKAIADLTRTWDNGNYWNDDNSLATNLLTSYFTDPDAAKDELISRQNLYTAHGAQGTPFLPFLKEGEILRRLHILSTTGSGDMPRAKGYEEPAIFACKKYPDSFFSVQYQYISKLYSFLEQLDTYLKATESQSHEGAEDAELYEASKVTSKHLIITFAQELGPLHEATINAIPNQEPPEVAESNLLYPMDLKGLQSMNGDQLLSICLECLAQKDYSPILNILNQVDLYQKIMQASFEVFFSRVDATIYQSLQNFFSMIDNVREHNQDIQTAEIHDPDLPKKRLLCEIGALLATDQYKNTAISTILQDLGDRNYNKALQALDPHKIDTPAAHKIISLIQKDTQSILFASNPSLKNTPNKGFSDALHSDNYIQLIKFMGKKKSFFASHVNHAEIQEKIKEHCSLILRHKLKIRIQARSQVDSNISNKLTAMINSVDTNPGLRPYSYWIYAFLLSGMQVLDKNTLENMNDYHKQWAALENILHYRAPAISRPMRITLGVLLGVFASSIAIAALGGLGAGFVLSGGTIALPVLVVSLIILPYFISISALLGGQIGCISYDKKVNQPNTQLPQEYTSTIQEITTLFAPQKPLIPSEILANK